MPVSRAQTKLPHLLHATITISLFLSPGERLSPPIIKGVREIYEPADLITVGCEPRSGGRTEPRPSIHWYMDGKEVWILERSPYDNNSSLKITYNVKVPVSLLHQGI